MGGGGEGVEPFLRGLDYAGVRVCLIFSWVKFEPNCRGNFFLGGGLSSSFTNFMKF